MRVPHNKRFCVCTCASGPAVGTQRRMDQVETQMLMPAAVMRMITTMMITRYERRQETTEEKKTRGKKISELDVEQKNMSLTSEGRSL